MFKYRFISKDDMDNITEHILIKADMMPIWNGSVNKIDIDSLIEFTYDLEIVWADIDYLATDGIILAAIKPSEKLIYMNEAKKELFEKKIGTMNFSKAHELGHWVLHVTKELDYEQLSFCDTDVYHCRDFVKRPPEEIQADMFAASILMPKDIITSAINEIKMKKKIGFRDLYRLCDAFEVSISALTNRAKDLKLIYINNDGQIFSDENEANGQISLWSL